MLMDLKLLSSILNELINRKDPSPHVKDALEHCDTKVELLLRIVREFEPDFTEHSGRVRLWKAFKAARKRHKLKRFRDSLQETKTTLLLALVPQFQMPPVYVEEVGKPISEFKYLQPARVCGQHETRLSQACNGFFGGRHRNLHWICVATTSIELLSRWRLSESNERNDSSCRYHTDNFRYSGNDEHNSDNKDADATASRNFSGTDLDLVRRPGFNQRRASQSRICHKTSATGTLFGIIWLRTASIQVNSLTGNKVDVISSFTFFPSWWLTRVGIKHGIEANLISTPTGWQFNFNPLRAVPDNSPIFNACRKGSIEMVRYLLQEGSASVRDTNSKGWTPLHFAALAESETNVDLCEFLISEGAEETALAFEGPTENALSPVTMFTATGKERPAEMKIKMLRLFEDCIDMSEPNSDGWTIIGDLVSSFNQESVSVASNSVTWFLRSLKPESMVAFGPKTLWHGLQHAARSFIDLEQKKTVVRNRFNAMVGGEFPESYGMAIAYWIVLLSIGKKLLPMLLVAGSILHVEGYDNDFGKDLDPTLLAKQLPVLFEAWCKALTNGLETVEEVLNSEFDAALVGTGWSGDTFREFKSTLKQRPKSNTTIKNKRCPTCLDDYSQLERGLVEPTWIAFMECVSSNHRYTCFCQELLEHYGTSRKPQTFLDNHQDSTEYDFEDEDFHDAESDLPETTWMTECQNLIDEAEKAKEQDLFQATAAHVYHTQARVWLGSYEKG